MKAAHCRSAWKFKGSKTCWSIAILVNTVLQNLQKKQGFGQGFPWFPLVSVVFSQQKVAESASKQLAPQGHEDVAGHGRPEAPPGEADLRRGGHHDAGDHQQQ